MKNRDSFTELYIEQLKDLCNAEKQLTKALPKMAKAATSKSLKEAILSHLEETKQQFQRVKDILTDLGESANGSAKCEAMEGLIEEGEEIIEHKKEWEDPVVDAGIIAAAQRVEHYEIAGYGTARYFAKLLGHDEAAQLLEQTLQEEENADRKLNEIAKDEINQKALFSDSIANPIARGSNRQRGREEGARRHT